MFRISSNFPLFILPLNLERQSKLSSHILVIRFDNHCLEVFADLLEWFLKWKMAIDTKLRSQVPDGLARIVRSQVGILSVHLRLDPHTSLCIAVSWVVYKNTNILGLGGVMDCRHYHGLLFFHDQLIGEVSVPSHCHESKRQHN